MFTGYIDVFNLNLDSLINYTNSIFSTVFNNNPYLLALTLLILFALILVRANYLFWIMSIILYLIYYSFFNGNIYYYVDLLFNNESTFFLYFSRIIIPIILILLTWSYYRYLKFHILEGTRLKINSFLGIGRNKNDNISNERDIDKIEWKEINVETMEEIIEAEKENKIWIGNDNKEKPIKIDYDDLNTHLHIMGGTGQGKTALGMAPISYQVIKQGHGAIVITFKEDPQLLYLMKKASDESNKNFYYFNLDDDEKPFNITYNPIESGTVLNRADRILVALELDYSGSASFFSNMQRDFLVRFFQRCDELEITPKIENLHDILEDKKLFENFMGYEFPKNDNLEGLRGALKDITLPNKINPEPGEGLNLKEIVNNEDVLYVCLSSGKSPSLSERVGQMLALDIREALFCRPKDQRDNLFLLAVDEFQKMASNALRDVITQVRDPYNVGLVFANQTLGQLEDVNLDKEITNNFTSQLVFSLDDPTEIELFSSRTGTKLFRARVNRQYSGKDLDGEFTNLTGGMEEAQGSISNEVTNRFHQNRFLKLATKEARFKSIGYIKGNTYILNHNFMVPKSEFENFNIEDYKINKKRKVKTMEQAVKELTKVNKDTIKNYNSDKNNSKKNNEEIKEKIVEKDQPKKANEKVELKEKNEIEVEKNIKKTDNKNKIEIKTFKPENNINKVDVKENDNSKNRKESIVKRKKEENQKEEKKEINIFENIQEI